MSKKKYAKSVAAELLEARIATLESKMKELDVNYAIEDIKLRELKELLQELQDAKCSDKELEVIRNSIQEKEEELRNLSTEWHTLNWRVEENREVLAILQGGDDTNKT